MERKRLDYGSGTERKPKGQKGKEKHNMILDSDIEIKQKAGAAALQSWLSERARKEADAIARDLWSYYYQTRNRKPKLIEYPPTVVACAQNNENYYIGKTEHHVMKRYINRDLLERLENRLGKYGDTSRHEIKFAIGHCAEPQAANELLKKEWVKDLDDIYFGDAYRPRTGVVIPPCGNCRETFNNVKKW